MKEQKEILNKLEENIMNDEITESFKEIVEAVNETKEKMKTFKEYAKGNTNDKLIQGTKSTFK